MPSELVLRGQPVVLDDVLRPAVRFFQLVVGGGLSLLLAWFALWWWVPVPLAGSFIAYEVFFWRRGDTACTLRLASDAIELTDPSREQVQRVALSTIHTATTHLRPGPGGDVDAFVVLGSAQGPVFAVRLRQRTEVPKHEADVPSSLSSAVIGGLAGLLRALAPNDRLCRQIVDDPDGRALAWLRGTVPASAWNRVGVRLWRGEEPDLDLFGYHVGAPDGWLVLDRTTRRWTLGEAQGSLDDVTTSRTSRSAILLKPHDRTNLDPEDIPVLLLRLGPQTQLAIPAPIAGTLGVAEPLRPDLLHTHVPEGAALVWQLLQGPRQTWPPALTQAVEDARIVEPDLVAMLPSASR